MESSPLHAQNFGVVVANLTSHAWTKLGAAVFLWIFGAHLMTLYTIFGLVILDTITGVWKAARVGAISSRGFFKFSTKLIVYTILLGNASLVDKQLGVTLAMSVMSGFLALTEAISVLENITILGWKVPQGLVRTLKVYQADPVKLAKSKPIKRRPPKR